MFAPNGALVTSAQQGDTLIWNPRTGRIERRFPLGGQPAIDAAGDRLALAINSPSLAAPTSRIALLDLRTRHIRFLPAGLASTWMRGFAFMPDGKSIVSATIHGEVDVWDVASGTLLATIPHAGGDQASEVLAPDGRTVLVGSQTGAVVAFDLAGMRRLGRAFQWGNQSCGSGLCLVVNRQSDLMATTTEESNSSTSDDEVALIDLRTLRRTALLPAVNGSETDALGFFPDGRTLLTGGVTGRLTLWNTTTHKVIRTIEIGAPVYWAAVSPDGKLIAVDTQLQGSQGSVVEVRPVAGGIPLWTHSLQDGASGLYFSPDGREVAALGCCTSLSTVASWDTRTGRNLFTRRSDEPCHGDRLLARLATASGRNRGRPGALLELSQRRPSSAATASRCRHGRADLVFPGRHHDGGLVVRHQHDAVGPAVTHPDRRIIPRGAQHVHSPNLRAQRKADHRLTTAPARSGR